MTAAEARQKAEQHNAEIKSSQFSRIVNSIMKAVSLGSFEIIFDEIIEPDTEELLKREGYKLSNGIWNINIKYQRKISW